MIAKQDLIAKYDIPAPRYTSYPTVPYWQDSPDTEEWLSYVAKSMEPDDSSLSIYVHIPFCESLCSFCGCNTSITKNHSVEEPYVEALLKEWSSYLERVPNLGKRTLKELHLGGGTPTYLSLKNMEVLLKGILEKCRVSDQPEFSIEVDPRRTSMDQLKLLHQYGFRRISLGVQDFDPEVQRLVNRIQPYEKTRFITEKSREMGYDSVNFDLIYGLPRQTAETMKDTIERTLQLRPDRIAFYSYAHVPWIKAAQRLFTEDDLPKGFDKRSLYELSRDLFEKNGYRELGMDHFALETDSLWTAFLDGKMHRNFMGYTTQTTQMLLGLGVSAISDSWDSYHQNEKVVKKYEKLVSENGFATLRGHKLSGEDLRQRQLLLELSTTWKVELPSDQVESVRSLLSEMEKDSLVVWNGNSLQITDEGQPFLRNVCMALDLRLRNNSPSTKVFSQSI